MLFVTSFIFLTQQSRAEVEDCKTTLAEFFASRDSATAINSSLVYEDSVQSNKITDS